MTAKIITLSGRELASDAPVPQSKPQNDMIEMLERALDQARKGEITEVALVKLSAPLKGGVSFATSWSTPSRDAFALHSGAAMLAARILATLDQSS